MSDDRTAPRDETTLTAGDLVVEREDFALIVVQHPDAAVVGERTRIPDGDLLELGRHSHCFGAGALDVPRLSRIGA